VKFLSRHAVGCTCDLHTSEQWKNVKCSFTEKYYTAMKTSSANDRT